MAGIAGPKKSAPLPAPPPLLLVEEVVGFLPLVPPAAAAVIVADAATAVGFLPPLEARCCAGGSLGVDF